VGDMRIVYPWAGCGHCRRCEAGLEQMCLAPRTLGIVENGGYGSHVIAAKPAHLVEFGDIDPAVAATYACSGITVYSAVKKIMPLSPDSPVVVVGAGGLGLNAIHILKALGHEMIIAVDIEENKRAAALAAGAAKVVDGSEDGLSARIVEAAGGPVDAVIDIVNSTATATAGLATLVKGGKLVLVGLFGGDLTIDLPLIPIRAVSIIGTYTGSVQDLRELVALAKEGKLKPLPVHVRPHGDPNSVLDELRSTRALGRLVLAV
jgi:alcohol dehydrogenase, propanol-preferring